MNRSDQPEYACQNYLKPLYSLRDIGVPKKQEYCDTSGLIQGICILQEYCYVQGAIHKFLLDQMWKAAITGG